MTDATPLETCQPKQPFGIIDAMADLKIIVQTEAGV